MTPASAPTVPAMSCWRRTELGRDITVNADIASSTGHLTLRAEGSIAINADLTTATDGTISLDAEGGALTMAGTSTIAATNSSVRPEWRRPMCRWAMSPQPT